ncbi:MobF family relaxase [Paludibacterium yongneupense]|nr:MobF family relaxase [Paludibacterium yongneupense]
MSKVLPGASAAGYYAGADDYYRQDSAPSKWMGAGAERLGLSGEVDAETFGRMLDGLLPNGVQLPNAAEGRRAATDFTFSAPKSVSVQTLVGGDARLVAAHELAVSRALGYAERLAGYRVTEDGVTYSEISGNLLVAGFRHDLSRALDPNLHTHAVAINATQRSDGEWRALEQTEFYHQQKLIGALYRNELALEVQRLGYEIRQTHHDGRFELAHFTEKQIEAFSQRSNAIEAVLAEQGKTREMATAREKEIIALATRDAKGEIDRAVLREQWREKSQELGIGFERPSPAELVQDRLAAARDAVCYAMAHTTERQSVVNQVQVIQAALEHGTGATDLESIRTELERQVADGAVISAHGHYTTLEAQQRERDMLSVEARGRGAVEPLLSEREARRTLDQTSLNAGQQGAACLLLSTDARISAIQGAAGTGKTTMLKTAHGMAEQQGYRVLGIAPSAAAARELGKAEIPSQTIASFLAREQSLDSKTVLVMDEAGMVSAKDMHAVLNAVEQANARIVMVGDTQQLKAVEAGRPFAQLQEAGMSTAQMGEIQRQHDAQLKNAVELAAQGQVERSLAVLDAKVCEIGISASRYAQIASDYAALDGAQRAETLIVAGTHYARDAINAEVRAQTGLAGLGMPAVTLDRKDMTAAQARSSVSYQPGDLVEALRNYESIGMARGEVAKVLGARDGRVSLEKADGQQVEWRPALQTYMTAYRVAVREFAPGDRVRVTGNDHMQGLVNGDRASVLSIDAQRQTITLMLDEQNTVQLDASKPLHLDHGYCSTIHSAQGQTVDRVLIDADTRSLTSNESAYYVAISRAREEVKIYTNDREMLPDVMSRQDLKSSALDLDRDRGCSRDDLGLGG